ncbi:transposase [Kitasatospora sp. NBC_01560]|uniref:IS701 family transposase n=1 Tax=Kitasatospora sp. NBC_01560 TaxID=2975965 RepID=UPI00386BE919
MRLDEMHSDGSDGSDGPVTLHAYVEQVFDSLVRTDQRRWARAYLSGLLNVPGKKTLQRLARSVSPSTAGAHGLQQFINASPWEWGPVRQAVARAVAGQAAPRAWTVAELTIPKRGDHSVGVHRRFDAGSGRTVNCQLASGSFLVGDAHCVPVDWQLALDESWFADEGRRRRARIPDGVPARPAWTHVLDFAGAVAGQPRFAALPWVLDLRRAPDIGPVAAGLGRLGMDFVCEVAPGQPVQSVSRAVAPLAAVGELMARSQARQPHLVVRQAHGRPKPVTMHSALVRLPRAGAPRGVSQRVYRVLVRPAVGPRQPARYWITSLTARRVEDVLGLVGAVGSAERTMADLEENFGVLDFEGRSYPGWHHHMTMASAAAAYRRLHAGSEAEPTGLRTRIPAQRLGGPARRSA